MAVRNLNRQFLTRCFIYPRQNWIISSTNQVPVEKYFTDEFMMIIMATVHSAVIWPILMGKFKHSRSKLICFFVSFLNFSVCLEIALSEEDLKVGSKGYAFRRNPQPNLNYADQTVIDERKKVNRCHAQMRRLNRLSAGRLYLFLDWVVGLFSKTTIGSVLYLDQNHEPGGDKESPRKVLKSRPRRTPSSSGASSTFGAFSDSGTAAAIMFFVATK